MPKYIFTVDQDGSPRSLPVDLPDREAAREYAIGLATAVLQRLEGSRLGESLITITDEGGDVLDIIKSVQC